LPNATRNFELGLEYSRRAVDGNRIGLSTLIAKSFFLSPHPHSRWRERG
jgi:hypothetical protein